MDISKLHWPLIFEELVKILLIFLLVSNVALAEKVTDFELISYPDHKKIKLSELARNKKIVLNFWATWCTSCVREIAILEDLKKRYHSEAEFIAIDAGESDNLIKRFIAKHTFSYNILIDENRLYSKSLGVTALPVTMVIDKDMNIIYRENVPPNTL